MDALEVLHLATLYAKRIVARKYPLLTSAKRRAKVRQLAESPRLRAMARIRLRLRRQSNGY